MGPLLIAALAVGAGYVVFHGSSGGSNPTPAATSAAQTAAYNQAQAFDAAANQLGLTQSQAQEAWDLGLTPAEYQAGMMNQPSSSSTSGPIDLTHHGEYTRAGAPIYRDDDGTPVVLDSDGNPWTFSEEAA